MLRGMGFEWATVVIIVELAAVIYLMAKNKQK